MCVCVCVVVMWKRGACERVYYSILLKQVSVFFADISYFELSICLAKWGGAVREGVL